MLRKLTAVLTFVSLSLLIACGGSDRGGPNSSGNTLLAVGVSTFAPQTSISNINAYTYLASTHGGGAGCLPGQTLRVYAYSSIRSDSLQTTVAQDSTSSVTWNTSNPAVATVSGGLVTCVAAGQANITATLSNASCESGPCVGSFTMYVSPTKYFLTLTPLTSSLRVGQQLTFTIVLNTQTASGTTTQDVSSNLGALQVAYVDSLNGNGNVITHLANNNVFSATKAGTAWGFAAYQVQGVNYPVISDFFTATVQ